MKPHVKAELNARAKVGILIVLDVDGDPHYIPWMQVRDMTDWVSKWGENVAVLTLGDSGGSHAEFKVGMKLEALVACYQRAAGGEVVDLRGMCGKAVYDQRATKKDQKKKDEAETTAQADKRAATQNPFSMIYRPI